MGIRAYLGRVQLDDFLFSEWFSSKVACDLYRLLISGGGAMDIKSGKYELYMEVNEDGLYMKSGEKEGYLSLYEAVDFLASLVLSMRDIRAFIFEIKGGEFYLEEKRLDEYEREFFREYFYISLQREGVVKLEDKYYLVKEGRDFMAGDGKNTVLEWTKGLIYLRLSAV